MQGVSLATLGEISFKNGRAEQTNFDGYELTRIDAAPTEIRTHLVNTTAFDKPLGGVGEPGVPPVAPALANAIFAASGKRIRTPADPRPARREGVKRTSSHVPLPR